MAEFERASDAVAAALAFQAAQAEFNANLDDTIRATVRAGIAMRELIVADSTVTGAGVVPAQRMEQLAEPGSVCITGAVEEAVPERMPFDEESLGEKRVKGFETPVRVYTVRLREGAEPPDPVQLVRERKAPVSRWALSAVTTVLIGGGALMAWYQPWAPEYEPVSPEAVAHPPLPDKPSIAVLPFDNLSEDRQQEYFADGMTDDLITDLSKVPELFVISRNSTFTYKDQAIKIRQVAEELGVHYVLEGSVRRAGDQVRINAQLIDGATGGHMWAERFDGTLEDIFALQDRITRKISTALLANLNSDIGETGGAGETDNPEAYDAFLRGWKHCQFNAREHLLTQIFERRIQKTRTASQRCGRG